MADQAPMECEEFQQRLLCLISRQNKLMELLLKIFKNDIELPEDCESEEGEK